MANLCTSTSSPPWTRRLTSPSHFNEPPRVIGGRYGLSSKEFTPAMAKAVLDELAAGWNRWPKRHFTVGIFDDVTSLSLPWDRDFRPPRPPGEVQAVFFGLGSDGTVGANKNSVKIIVDATDALYRVISCTTRRSRAP